MGQKNYLIEGVSATGKTTVCYALQNRGYHVLNCDQILAYQGDPATGKPAVQPKNLTPKARAIWQHTHHIWDVDRVKLIIADQSNVVSFFCGGSRNFPRFIDLFDNVFILEIDHNTLMKRLAKRPEDEFGGKPYQKELIIRLHETKEDVPEIGITVDATKQIDLVINEILEKIY